VEERRRSLPRLDGVVLTAHGGVVNGEISDRYACLKWLALLEKEVCVRKIVSVAGEMMKWQRC
jgi:hypothetical protein